METIRFLGRIFQTTHSDPELTADDISRRPDFTPQPIGHAYAPTIVRWNGQYHLFFCAADYGPHGCGGGDMTRHSTSTDGIQWTKPKIILYPHYSRYPRKIGTPPNEVCEDPSVAECTDCCCCDPSIVHFKGYWYLFYSGCPREFGTAIYVARSSTIDGPYHETEGKFYKKYTVRQTWEERPSDPAVLIRPVNPNPGYYGAGQQTVVEKDGKLLMWFTDTTLQSPTRQVHAIRFATSDDAVKWSQEVVVAKDENGSSLISASIDIKRDEERGKFVCFDIWNPVNNTPDFDGTGRMILERLEKMRPTPPPLDIIPMRPY